VNRAGIGTGHDHKIRVCPGVQGGFDLADHFLRGYHLAAGHVAAFFWQNLILKLDNRDSGFFVSPDCARNIYRVAKPGVRVGNYRNPGRFHNGVGAGQHFRIGYKPHVGAA